MGLTGGRGRAVYNLEGTGDWDTKGRLQASMERPVGKQLGILPC